MADISQKELREEITAILKDADLNTTSAKKVRMQIEKKLDIDLSDRKKEVDDLVMECLQQKQNKNDDDDDEEEEEEEEDEESEEEKKPKKRAPPKKAAKRKKASDSESEDDEEASDEEYSPKKKTSPKKGKGKKAAKGSDDSDDDWKQPKKSPAKKAAGGAKRGGGGGYNKSYTLSPELAAVVGQESMARHEVVKKVWAIIKERNLYDPKNKQFAICDDQMQKVFGVKRFRTFGMMKYLKDHFID